MSDIKFDIIRDSHEKKFFWTFANYDEVREIVDKKLDTGDYTIKGLENKLCIERKHSIAEFAKNIVEKRFKAQLQRMNKFDYSYLILEFGLDDVYNYPYVKSIPYDIRKKIKIRGPFLFKKLAEITVKYDVNIFLCQHPKYAEEMVISLMKRVYERENRQNT